MNDSSLIKRDSSELPTLFAQIPEQIEQLLLLLSERERFVIEKRFALDLPERSTLEEIGQHFSVTRERVRQIEKNALQKLTRNISNFVIFQINDHAFALLQEHGGILSEDIMLSKLILESKDQYTAHSLLFILSLDKRFQHLSNTIKYVPYFRLENISDAIVEDVARTSLEILQKEDDVLPVEQLREKIVAQNEAARMFSPQALLSLFQIHKGFKVIDEKVGLIQWKHIHPRTLRDKIYFILRREREAMHFIDIANAIVDAAFDKKKVNLQAVHNELIRHPDFILIGRGIYALKEWGFNSGTVADVIASILKGKPHMSEDEIIEEVLKQRQVKPITIILNLKNKPQFIRVGRKRYTFKKK